MKNILIEGLPGRWVILNGLTNEKPKDDKYTLHFVFSSDPLGYTELKFDSIDDGDSSLIFDRIRFGAAYGLKIKNTDKILVRNFEHKEKTSRGEIIIKFEINTKDRVSGISITGAKANSFDDSIKFYGIIGKSIISSLSVGNNIPIYLSKIISFNSVKSFQSCVLLGFKHVNFDYRFINLGTSELKLHALNLYKETLVNYPSPVKNLASHYSLYELFYRCFKQTERQPKASSKYDLIKNTMEKKIKSLYGESPVENMTYQKAFSIVKNRFRNPASHGGHDADNTFLDHESFELFFEAMKYQGPIKEASIEIYKTILQLPDDYQLSLKKR